MRKVRLKDVVNINPRRTINKGDITPYISMSNLEENKRKIQKVEERVYKGSGSRFMNGDTLFARITPCLENGKTAFVDVLSKNEVANGSTEFIVFRGKEGLTDNLFVYYLSRSDRFRRYAIKSMTGTSGRQRVQIGSIENYEFILPPLEEQKRIAHILGTLDDKIELNQRMNETLEAIARAIFKSWFVDFDPVRAKMTGEPYPLPDEIMALFPDALVESELGMIPKGWEVVELKEIVKRLTPKNRYRKNEVTDSGKTPVFEQGNELLMGFHNNKPDFVASPEQPKFIFGDHTCNMRLICEPFSVGPNVIPLIGKRMPNIWVYYAARGKQTFQEYRRHWMEFKIKQAVKPNSRLLVNYFADLCEGFLEGKNIYLHQNLHLKSCRNIILKHLFQ